MKKSLLLAAVCLPLCFTSCSKEDEKTIDYMPPIETPACKIVTLDAPLASGTPTAYQWVVESAPSEEYALANATTAKVTFAATTAGVYQLKLTTTEGTKSESYPLTIIVKAPAAAPSPYISKVYEFLPAPGQFTNNMPLYENNDTEAKIIAKVEKALAGKANAGLISLGGFGGYVSFGFDHTVVNVKGKRDIRINGNAFYSDNNPNPNASAKGGECEPGIIMVAYDANKNGKPDKEEWYEIAGSEYGNPTTIKNYRITYYRPTTEDPEADGGIKEYIKWEDNQNHSGYKTKNMFHQQSYYPAWTKEDKIIFTGTLLPNNAVNEGDNDNPYWVLYSYGSGYADNALNNEENSAFDISWAVDAAGKSVELPGVDFVKVYTGVNQEAGWLGEVSTEITGASDLHIEKAAKTN